MVFLRSHARSALETNGNANNNSNTHNRNHVSIEDGNANNNSHNHNRNHVNIEDADNFGARDGDVAPFSTGIDLLADEPIMDQETLQRHERLYGEDDADSNLTNRNNKVNTNTVDSLPPLKLKHNEIRSDQPFDNTISSPLHVPAPSTPSKSAKVIEKEALDSLFQIEDDEENDKNPNTDNNQKDHASSLIQHQTGIAGSTKSQTGNAGNIKDTHYDVDPEHSTPVSNKMAKTAIASSKGLRSKSRAKKSQLSSSSSSTTSKSSSSGRLWYCNGTCTSGNGQVQHFKNFQTYVGHLRSMHHLESSSSLASAINTCQHNRLYGNPPVYRCPHADCNQVCIEYVGVKAHWGLRHFDDRFTWTSEAFKTKYPSCPKDLFPDSSSTMSEVPSEVTSASHHGCSTGSMGAGSYRPHYTNGLDELLEEHMNAKANAESKAMEEEEDDEGNEEDEEEIYGLPDTNGTPTHHDDEHFEVSEGEPDDAVNQPIITVDQVVEGTVVEPSPTPKIDYFEAISEEGTIVFPNLTVSVLTEQARVVIDDFLALSEADQLELICGVPHLRTDDVDWKHKEVYRSITRRLMRASIGRYLPFYITCIRRGEIVHDDVLPTAMEEEDVQDMEVERRAPLTDEQRAITATVAFHLLPTIYRMIKTSKRSIRGSPGAFLDGLLAIGNTDQLIGSIIFLFNKGRPKLGPNHTNNFAPPSDATIIRKTKKLVLEDGHVSRGMNYLCRHAEKDNDVEPPPQLSNDEFQSKVTTLHPKRHPEHDNLDLVLDCPTDPNLDTLKLKATTLNSTLRRLKRDGAPGFDGWTFQLIRQLFEQDLASINDDEPSEDAILLIAFITHALAGRMPFSSLWNTSRMVLLSEWQPQKQTWKFRPLAIGTAWYRFIGKAALAMLGDSVGRQLAPCQLAVGIPDGISIGALLLQHVREDPDNAILSLDISNAFNSLRRNRILEGLRQYAPSLIPFYKWSYSLPTQVRSSTGVLCCDAETGTRQGDPLSMLFFSVGIHHRILQLSGRIQKLNSETMVQAYADDMSLCIPRRNLKQAWDIVADVFPIGLPGNITHDPHDLFAEIGIAINPIKCVAITGSPTPTVRNRLTLEAEDNDADNDQIEEATLHTGQAGVVIPIRLSAKIFGVMIGTREDRLTFVHDLHDQIRKKADYIKSFCGAKAGFLLIKYCLNTIATYVHRIEAPIDIDLAGHDKIISDALAFYVHKNHFDTTQELIRGLPHSLGGLGILRHDSFQTRINHDELHIRTLSWLKHKGPSPVTVEGIQSDNDAGQLTITHPGLHKLHRTFPPLNQEPHYLATIGFHKGERETLSASTRKLNAHKENAERLKKRLVSNYNTMGDALWLDGSGFNGSGDLYNIGTFYTRFFTDRTFAATLGARLLINDTLPQTDSTNMRVYCPHCNMLDLPFPPTAVKYHYLGCRALQRSTVGRHDRIVNHLHRFLSRVLPDTAEIQCEQYTHQSDIDQRRDDITLTLHTGEVYLKLGFDIGITTPVQSTLLERSLKSNQAVDSLLAATNMFEEKTHKYRNSHYDVYPIIFLATGRPSNHMKKMLTALEPYIAVDKTEFHARWRRFLRDTMCTCTQFVAKAYLNRPALLPDIYRNQRAILQQRRLTQTRLRLTRKRKIPSSSTDIRKRNTLLTKRTHNTHHQDTPLRQPTTIADDDSVIHLNSTTLQDDDNSWASGNPFNKPKDRTLFQ